MGVEVFRKEAMSFDGRTVLPRGLSRKFAHQVMNGNDVLNFVGIGAEKTSALSTSPLTALMSAMVMQYGVVRGSQVLRQWKQFLTFSRCLRIRFTKGLRSARPGIWTGLWTIVTSSFFALTYICLNSSAASHSFVATKRVAICTPERPRER